MYRPALAQARGRLAMAQTRPTLAVAMAHSRAEGQHPERLVLHKRSPSELDVVMHP